MKKIISILLTAVIVFTLAGCSGGNSIVGTWKLDVTKTAEIADGEDSEGAALASALLGSMEITMTFTADNKVTTSASAFGQTSDQEAEYKLDGDNLTIIQDGSESKAKIRFDGGYLIIEADDGAMAFSRQ